MEQKILFKTSNDIELYPNEQNHREASYIIYGADKNKGLVVYIPGFGADLSDYRNKFCKKINEKYGLASMTVDYFCIGARISTGAKIYFEDDDIETIKKTIPNFTVENYLQHFEKYTKNSTDLTTFNAGLMPPNNEYQNFGILAALDIANAIKDAVEKFNLDTNNITLVGSSYGGYLANLVTKIIPGEIKLVLDNSSWANPNYDYIAGREINSPEFIYLIGNNLKLTLFTKSPWTLKPNLKNSFEKCRLEIRSFDNNQIEQMAAQGAITTSYVIYHSSKDHVIAPIEDKKRMVKELEANGFNSIKFKIFYHRDIITNKIRSLDHGMGLSMLNFFEDEYPKSTTKQFISKPNKKTSYNTENAIYYFVKEKNLIKLKIEYI